MKVVSLIVVLVGLLVFPQCAKSQPPGGGGQPDEQCEAQSALINYSCKFQRVEYGIGDPPSVYYPRDLATFNISYRLPEDHPAGCNKMKFRIRVSCWTVSSWEPLRVIWPVFPEPLTSTSTITTLVDNNVQGVEEYGPLQWWMALWDAGPPLTKVDTNCWTPNYRGIGDAYSVEVTVWAMFPDGQGGYEWQVLENVTSGEARHAGGFPDVGNKPPIAYPNQHI